MLAGYWRLPRWARATLFLAVVVCTRLAALTTRARGFHSAAAFIAMAEGLARPVNVNTRLSAYREPG
jgi:hypothetical protein